MNREPLFEQIKLDAGPYGEESLLSTNSDGGWPRDTWFRKRLRYVREQQGKKFAEADFVYECRLGVITLGRSNGGK